MQPVTELALSRADRGIFTRLEAGCWLNDERPSLDGRLKRAVASGEALRIRRGLYGLNPRYLSQPIHPYALAQRIHGPSYISQESALTHHGWIPEAVYTITSTSLGRSRSFDTPMGVFTFKRVPQNTFFVGVRRVDLGGNQTALIASPLKALADYVYAHSLDWQRVKPLVESLRVEEIKLETLTTEDFDLLIQQFPTSRVRNFLNGLQKDLHL